MNCIQLNYDTVVEAIQEYLDKRFVASPIVKGIGTTACGSWSSYPTQDVNGHTAMPGHLEVRVQEPVAFLKGEKT